MDYDIKYKINKDMDYYFRFKSRFKPYIFYILQLKAQILTKSSISSGFNLRMMEEKVQHE